MIRLVVVLLASLVLCSQAHAAFVSATWGTAGNGFQQSFGRLQAEARGTGETVESGPFAFPHVGSLSATAFRVGDWARADASEAYSLQPDALQVDVTRLDRDGPSTVFSNGSWLFSVTEATRSLASGFLVTDSAGSYTENYLRARLDDLTAGEMLFQSVQEDFFDDRSYSLGGIQGNRAALFSGSLENVLVPNHVYRLIYSLGVSRLEASAGESQATGRITLTALSVPEPSTLALALAAFGAMLSKARLAKRRSAAASPNRCR